MTLTIMDILATLSIIDTWYKWHSTQKHTTLRCVSRFFKCYTERHYAERHYAERHYAERHYAERHYAECRYAECRGAVNQPSSYYPFPHHYDGRHNT